MEGQEKIESICLNCKHLLWLVALGQGLKCGSIDKNKGKSGVSSIPSSTHTCKFFEYKNLKKSDS